MSETPRTDKAQNEDMDYYESGGYDFARQLERELAAANERAARLEGDKAIVDWIVATATAIDCVESVAGNIDRYTVFDTTREALLERAALRPDSAQKENKS